MTAPSILIVDDDELRCELLAELLEGEGFAVTIANDGESGLDVAAQGGFDLILLDIIMPKVDGVRFLQTLPQRVDTAPPIIVISGSVDSIAVSTLETLGIRSIIRKPIKPQALLDAIHALFDGDGDGAGGG